MNLPHPAAIQPDWAPFQVCVNRHAPKPRNVHSVEGVGDRLRAAAFAEIQARDAFLWAAETFTDASPSLQRAWRALALAEQRHLDWLLNRLKELHQSAEDRPVSSRLWESFMRCQTAEAFAVFMASAEERGRLAGERFYLQLKTYDPVSAEIFRKIAEEEIEHIRLAEKYFPQTFAQTFGTGSISGHPTNPV